VSAVATKDGRAPQALPDWRKILDYFGASDLYDLSWNFIKPKACSAVS
jgi:hypothetical protein